MIPVPGESVWPVVKHSPANGKSCVDSIAVRHRRRYNQNHHLGVRFISELMRDAGRDFDALAFTELMAFAAHLDHRCSPDDVEELPRAAVEVPLLLVPGRNALFDDAEIFALQKVPAFAAVAPSVMLSGRDILDGRWRRGPCLPFDSSGTAACTPAHDFTPSDGWFIPSTTGTSSRSYGLIPSRHATLKPNSVGFERR